MGYYFLTRYEDGFKIHGVMQVPLEISEVGDVSVTFSQGEESLTYYGIFNKKIDSGNVQFELNQRKEFDLQLI